MMPVFAFVNLLAEKYTKGRGRCTVRGREWICVAIDGKMGGRLGQNFIYTAIFTVS